MSEKKGFGWRKGLAFVLIGAVAIVTIDAAVITGIVKTQHNKNVKKIASATS